MKLLFITGSFPPERCGVGDYTASLARVVADQQGHNVFVLTGDNSGEHHDNEGVEVLRAMPSWGLCNLRRFMSLMREISPEVMHIQYPTQGYRGGLLPWLIPLISFLMGCRVIQTWHEGFGIWRAPMFALLVMVPGPIIVVRPNYLDALHPFFRWLTTRKTFCYIPSAPSIPRSKLGPAEARRFRARYPSDRKLLVFFGFLYPSKGVDRIFEFADPSRDFLVIAGAVPEDGRYLAVLQNRASRPDWSGLVCFEGEVSADYAANLLAVADVVVLPFESGGGEWNSSLLAAKINRAFVVTTSRNRRGYESETDTYYACPGDNKEMAEALRKKFSGGFHPARTDGSEDDWQRVARQHLTIYAGGVEGKLQR